MKYCFFILLAVLCVGCDSKITLNRNHLNLFKEMFQEVTVKKQADKIPDYYHKDFILISNGKEMNYEEFLSFHQNISETPIQYTVEYDEPTFVEEDNKVSGRMWITVQLPDEDPKEIEVILIAQYKGDKLYRLWELTHPDWSREKGV